MKRYRFKGKIFTLALLIILSGAGLTVPAEPDLPEGLKSGNKSSDEPALPSGLGTSSRSQERKTGAPPLPAGLGREKKAQSSAEQKPAPEFNLPFGLNGFVDGRLGTRVHKDPSEKDLILGETRLQIQAEKNWPGLGMNLTTDFYYDGVLDQAGILTDTEEGYVDLREANIFITPASFMDIKAGRQILTWGVGDLLFINDLFPKDYVSFFIGRNVEYLKAPSNAVKVSFFSQWANLNVVYTPRFDPDRYITGRRLSYYHSGLGRIAGREAVITVDKPDSWFRDDEIALRFYRNVKGYELALYGYRGFWKSPAGTDPLTGKAFFPELRVYGASVRGRVLKGIGSLEAGYYDSAKNREGDNPFIRNGEFRFLLGYEQELAKEFTAGLQYYLEHMMDYSQYRANLPTGVPPRDENRHVLTLRLTKLLMNQDLTLSLFTFYSPSDRDAYLRPKIHYKINDRWGAELGGNIFFGDRVSSFFAQFEKNSNVYSGVRYSF